MEKTLGEKARRKALPDELVRIFEAEEIRECILESLVDEMISPKEHLDETDYLDVVRDALDFPKEYAAGNKPISLHKFTIKSLSKCKVLPYPLYE